MEPLTDREMFEIEGGDWWGLAGGVFDALLMFAACL